MQRRSNAAGLSPRTAGRPRRQGLILWNFMPEQILKQRSRGFICVNAHPAGCARNVDDQIAVIEANRPAAVDGPKNVLVVGGSTGYGLASRITAAWGFRARTLGVFFEKEPLGKRTATAGYYNSTAFHRAAERDGLWAKSLNGDAFSDVIKDRAAELIRSEMGPLDLVVYSLAAPKRTDPRSGETFSSALKSIGAPYSGKTIDPTTAALTEASLEPASEEDIAQTIRVMGGEDWQWWIEKLAREGLLASGAKTVAYSYIGPEQTWPIYRDGTIGAAKDDLKKTADALNERLRETVGGAAYVAVNKAAVTQASAAIPMIPLYISLLFRVMKRKGIHESAIQQMKRLFCERLVPGREPAVDSSGMIRMDDWEMRDDVQREVAELWPRVTTENLSELADFAGFRREFNQLFGFEVEGVDYEQPVESEIFL